MEQLEFLDIQALHHESVAQTTCKQPTSAIEWKVLPRPSYAAWPDSTCLACKEENHPLHSCPKFQGMSCEERWAVIKKNGLCLNCLRRRHMANKCCVPQTCQKCHKHHHSLLHIDDIKLPEEADTHIVSNVRHVPALKKNEQVLLMTCRAQITGPKEITSQARVFLDPGAACSFITEGKTTQR